MVTFNRNQINEQNQVYQADDEEEESKHDMQKIDKTRGDPQNYYL